MKPVAKRALDLESKTGEQLEHSMTTDDELLRLLRAVQGGDEADVLADNGTLASALGWPLAAVASCLQEAKQRSFIWGMRSGQTPAPWYTDLELTVQGRRFLKHTP